MDGQTEHWSTGFQHESLAVPEARESFTKTMSKFKTQEDAIVAYPQLEKMNGKPYRLPESIDKLDEKTRGEFTTNARKLLNIEDGIASLDDLADVNLADGLPEGFPVNEGFANAFKQFAAENKLPKSLVAKLAGFNNQALAGELQKMEAAKTEQAKATNEALVKHFGGEDKVKERSELVKRFYKNNAGLTPEEYEQVGDEIAGIIARNPILARVHLEKIADLAGEGSTLTGGGGNPVVNDYQKQQDALKNSPSGKAVGWNK